MFNLGGTKIASENRSDHCVAASGLATIPLQKLQGFFDHGVVRKWGPTDLTGF